MATKTKGPISQHKQMAMGKKPAAMAKGGSAKGGKKASC
jgi:hypothetical protein